MNDSLPSSVTNTTPGVRVGVESARDRVKRQQAERKAALLNTPVTISSLATPSPLSNSSTSPNSNTTGSGGVETASLSYLQPSATSKHPLPEWLTELRPHQLEALGEIDEAYKSGAQLVWLDAPTGAGKTAIGECTRRKLQVPALYVCSGLTLQDQFLRDFDYAHVLKGKSNYPSTSMLQGKTDATCDLCTIQGSGGSCFICPDNTDTNPTCPYILAKQAATTSELAVLNTTYLLHEANGRRPTFSGQQLIIADECDELESELLRYTEFRITENMALNLQTQLPGKSVHYATIAKWLAGPVAAGLRMQIEELSGRGKQLDIKEIQRKNRLRRLHAQAQYTATELLAEGWVRDYSDSGALVLKPISVQRFGEPLLWRHSSKWLAMSATIVSPEQMSDDIGAGHLRQATVRVPMTFPVENRPIFIMPVANMSHKTIDEGRVKCATAIANLLVKHDGERVVVHTVSFALTKYLTETLRKWNSEGRLGNRKIITYTSSQTRELAIARYRKTPNAVILAPSLDRGVDFPNDDCRVVIVAKVPYASLGDAQVKAKMSDAGGQTWYTVDAIRSLVQMTGRGMRHMDDGCTSYILDHGFMRLWKEHKRLMPKWWVEAVNTRVSTRFLRDVPERP